MAIKTAIRTLFVGVGRVALTAILIGVFFAAFGVLPWEMVVRLYTVPPAWLLNPFVRFGAIVIGLAIIWAAQKYDVGAWPRSRRLRREFIEQVWASLDSSAIVLARDIALLGFTPRGANDQAWQRLERSQIGVRDSSTDRRTLNQHLEPFITQKLRRDGYLHGTPATSPAATVRLCQIDPAACRDKLLEFRNRFGELIDTVLPRDISEEKYDAHKARADALLREAATWVGEHVGETARGRLLDRSDAQMVIYPNAAHERHNRLLIDLSAIRRNLDKIRDDLKR